MGERGEAAVGRPGRSSTFCPPLVVQWKGPPPPLPPPLPPLPSHGEAKEMESSAACVRGQTTPMERRKRETAPHVPPPPPLGLSEGGRGRGRGRGPGRSPPFSFPFLPVKGHGAGHTGDEARRPAFHSPLRPHPDDREGGKRRRRRRRTLAAAVPPPHPRVSPFLRGVPL